MILNFSVRQSCKRREGTSAIINQRAKRNCSTRANYEGERVVTFADVPGDEGYRTSTGFREMSEASGVRSAIWVALRKDDALLGTITVYRPEVRPFTDKQVALLQNFAAQAV